LLTAASGVLAGATARRPNPARDRISRRAVFAAAGNAAGHLAARCDAGWLVRGRRRPPRASCRSRSLRWRPRAITQAFRCANSCATRCPGPPQTPLVILRFRAAGNAGVRIANTVGLIDDRQAVAQELP
jgi:hypothetical protein